MSSAQLLALIIHQGLPAALKIAQILKEPEQEVTDEMWKELKEVNARSIEFYEGPRVNL